MLLAWETNGKWAAQSPIGESEGEAWSEDESASSSGSRCASSGCLGLVTRSLFLKDWELAEVALSCQMALDMRQEMHEAWQGDATERTAVTGVLFSHRGPAVTAKRVVVRGNNK